METIQTILQVAKQLRGLFADKGELRGLDDWDSLLGCIVALEALAIDLQNVDEETNDGE